MQRIARFYRSKFSVPVIAVTGSNGKTTTKELISFLLKDKFRVLASAENFNNHIGVPKTLFEISKDIDIVVLEFAMRGRGEIAELACIAKPSIGVITNIGEAHLGRLGSIEAIAMAKGELLEFLPPDGLALINADNEWAGMLSSLTRAKVLTFGFAPNAKYKAEIVEYKGEKGLRFLWNTPEATYNLYTPLPGKHNLYNLMPALIIAEIFGLSLESEVKRLADFTFLSRRFQFKNSANGYLVIDDCYNSSPTALKNIVEFIISTYPARRKVLVLGDMLELGESASLFHYQLGKEFASNGIYIFATGELSRYFTRGAEEIRRELAFYYSDKEQLVKELLSFLRPLDIVVVKGSRAMQMEKVVEKLL